MIKNKQKRTQKRKDHQVDSCGIDWKSWKKNFFNFSSEYQGCQFNGISVSVKEPLALDGYLRHATPYIYTEFRIDVRAWEHNCIQMKEYDVSTHNLHEFTAVLSKPSLKS